MEMPDMYPVESSNVGSIGYDDEERILHVTFIPKGNSEGSHYIYYDVEPEIWEQFFAAPSKGKFIWSHLRDRYDYERVG